MKPRKQLPLFFLLLVAGALNAQINFQQNISAGNCPYDTTVTGLFPKDYEIYLTKNDKYEGEIDSNWCPTFIFDERNNRYDLDLTGFDFARPVHFRLRYPAGQGPEILPYRDHLLDFSLWNVHVALRELTGCGDDCSRQILKTLAEDSIPRVFEYGFSDAYPEIGATNCFFSERFERQRLTEMGMTLYLESARETPRLTTYGFFLTEVDYQPLRKEVTDISFGPNEYDGTKFRSSPYGVVSAKPREGAEDPFYFIPQVEEEIPGNDRFRYTEANVVPNPDTPVTMELLIYAWDDIVFPPYTGLIPGKVAGQDSQRHELNIIYDDWYFGACANLIAERVIPTNTVQEVGNDLMNFGNNAACVMLETGGGFSVGSGSTLHYGQDGKGLFASRDGGKLILREGATMTIGNQVRLLQIPGTSTGGLHLYLEPGSELIFDQTATVERKYASADTWVWVHDRGGRLNMETLSPEEQALFKYSEVESMRTPVGVEDLILLGNPVRLNTVEFQLPAQFAEMNGQYRVHDLIGQEQLRGSFLAGQVEITLPPSITNGSYLLSVKVGETSFVAKMVVMR